MKKESSGAGATLMKTKSSGANSGDMLMKKELRSRSCVIFTTAPQPCFCVHYLRYKHILDVERNTKVATNKYHKWATPLVRLLRLL